MILNRLEASAWNITYSFFQPGNRIWWPFLVSAYVIAVAYYFLLTKNEASFMRRIRKSIASCFPREIILHPSAILDYKFFLLNGLLYSAFISPFMITVSSATILTEHLLEKVVGIPDTFLPVTYSFYIVTTLCVALADDLGRYISHWLHHRIPVLWNMHKVHHTATVMTPITLYRVHPIELFLHGSTAGLFGGAIFGLGRYLSGGELTVFEILNMNIIVFAVAILGSNLRHSHVWIRYPNFISKIIMSPAQHQVHHSRLKIHHDKNLGSALSIWDWLFGTLYLPARDEKLEFGITSKKETAEFSTLKSLYWLPIKQSLAILGGSTKTKGVNPEQKSKDKPLE